VATVSEDETVRVWDIATGTALTLLSGLGGVIEAVFQPRWSRVADGEQRRRRGHPPLELWLVAYLQDHPAATRAEVMAASELVRQEVYGGLFKSHSTHKQNVRIRVLLEQDVFDSILQDWQRHGYRFGHLTPSFGSAIGSSCDRPDALANLMRIILNNGMRLPTVDLQRLEFSAGTPYATDMAIKPEPKRVLAPEVAETVRRAFVGGRRGRHGHAATRHLPRRGRKPAARRR
jgi:hypothetical protein